MQQATVNPPVSDEDAANALANGHPKSKCPPLYDAAPVLPGSPGSGAAPGSFGPPTTGDTPLGFS